MDTYCASFSSTEIIGYLYDLLVLVVAAALGGIIGFERERRDQPAGLRTHMVLCVGAALVTLVSLQVAVIYSNADPSRIAAQIVSGIGFLGAGAILKYGTTVRGLTTATSLWTVAGIGMAVGFHLWVPAVIATALVYFAMEYMRRLERTLFAGRSFKTITVTARDAKGLLSQVHGALEAFDIAIIRLEVSDLLLEKKIQLHLYVKTRRELDVSKLQAAIERIEGVVEFDIA